jgi:WD40 repeat protein
VFVWRPVGRTREARRGRDLPAEMCFEAAPPARLLERRVSSLAFLSEARLVAVGGDDANTMLMWDLASGAELWRGSANQTSPVFLARALYGWRDSGGRDANACADWGALEAGQVSNTKLVTTGAKHVSFWSTLPPPPEGGPEGWASASVSLGDNALCVACALSADAVLPAGLLAEAGLPTSGSIEIYTGQQDGAIVRWVAGQARDRVAAAHNGGVTALFWTRDGLLSGGADCHLRLWVRAPGGALAPQAVRELDLRPLACAARPHLAGMMVPKSMDVHEDGRVLIGTSAATVLVLPSASEWAPLAGAGDGAGAAPLACDARASAEVLLEAHAARSARESLAGLVTWPLRGYAPAEPGAERRSALGAAKQARALTCGADATLREWDLAARRLVRAWPVEARRADGVVQSKSPVALDLAPNGRLLAVGMADGSWALYLLGAGADGREEWLQWFATDVGPRRMDEARLAELKRRLAAQLDPARNAFGAHFERGKNAALGAQIEQLQASMAAVRDLAVPGAVSAVAFAPDGATLAVASSTGAIEVFSVRSVSVRGADGEWRALHALPLEAAHVAGALEGAVEECAGPEAEDARAAIARLNREVRRGVRAGERALPGLRGEVKRVGSCAGHGAAVWPLPCSSPSSSPSSSSASAALPPPQAVLLCAQ